MHKAYRIYPSIGIARVGDSQTESYFGPEAYLGLPTEIVGGKEQPITSFRDGHKRVKRQAARFYIYGFDDTGKGAKVHIGQDDIVDIEWTVHIANKKAIWYQFEQLEGEQGYEPSHPLRNKEVTDPAQRKKMMIDPGPRTIHGPNARAEFSRDTAPSDYPATFPPKGLKPFEINTLGGIRTDEVGRLLVLGGPGSSGTTFFSSPYSPMKEPSSLN